MLITRTHRVTVEVKARRHRLGPFSWYGKPHAHVVLVPHDGMPDEALVFPGDGYEATIHTHFNVPDHLVNEVVFGSDAKVDANARD